MLKHPTFKNRFVRACLLVALIAPVGGVAVVKLGAQAPGGEQPTDDSGAGGCACDCGGGVALCKTVICSDGTSKSCNREKQTQPPAPTP